MNQQDWLQLIDAIRSIGLEIARIDTQTQEITVRIPALAPQPVLSTKKPSV